MDNVDLKEEDISIKKIWNRQGSNNRNNKTRNNNSYQNRGARRSPANGNQSEKSGVFCPGCYYLSQQLNAPIHFRHTPGDCPRKAVNVKMVKMEDDAYFNETGDGHIGNGNVNNISSHYDKIEFKTAVSCQTESNPKPSLHVASEVNVLIQSVETNDCGTPIVKPQILNIFQILTENVCRYCLPNYIVGSHLRQDLVSYLVS